MKYQLDDVTVDLLKNFASINPQVMFRAGTLQRACNGMRNFIADVEFPQPFPTECAVYELNQLLGILDTCRTDSGWPVLEFGTNSMVVVHDHGRVTLPYAHPGVVASPPTQTYHMAKPIASFTLTNTLWTKIKRTAAVLKATEIHVSVSPTGEFSFSLVNEKDRSNTAGSASYTLPGTTVHETVSNTWCIKFDALNLLPGDYTVEAGEVGTSAHNKTLFGMFFKLNDATKSVTYLTSGTVAKSR